MFRNFIQIGGEGRMWYDGVTWVNMPADSNFWFFFWVLKVQ